MTGRQAFYVPVVIAAGAAALLHSLVTLTHTPAPLDWLLLALLAILTVSFTINIPSISASISVADTFLIATALLFGPAPATVALAIGDFVLSWRKGHDWRRVAFNAVAPALSLWVGAQAFFLIGRAAPLSVAPHGAIGPLITPLMCLASIYFIINSGLISIAIGLETRQSALRIWRSHFQWLWLGYLAAASVALCLVLITRQLGVGAVAVIIPVVVVFHRTLGASFGRLEDAHRHVSQIDRLYTSTIETLAMAIDAKDDVTHSHVRRVQAHALALAKALGITDAPTLKAIEAAALLHDTGKLGVPEYILNKPGALTAAEFEQMKRHVDVGADILSLVDFPYPVVPIVRCHHECWDGSGYPRGIAGSDIPIGARILSVVDCFDALTSDRPYRPRLTDDAALDILRDRRGRMYDPKVVDAFIRTYRDVPMVGVETPQETEVLRMIHASRQTPVTGLVEQSSNPVADTASPHAADEMLAFVSLARLASGAITVADVLALATNLIRNVVPTASGAWYMVNTDSDRLVATQPFGPAATLLHSHSMAVGDRLTGWVAANRQVIVNSNTALDLGDRARQGMTPLRSCLSVPLVDGGSLKGVLTLYGADRNAFTDGQGRLLQMIAPHIAQAVDAARHRADQPAIQTKRDLRIVR